MAFNYDYQQEAAPQALNQGVIDAGLRAYMVRVYNWMALGLAVTGLSAWAVAHTALLDVFFSVAPNGVAAPTGLGWLAVLAPLAFVLVLSFGVSRLSRSAAQALFLAFSVCMGISCATLLLAYTGVSVTRTFLISASAFAGLSFAGYTARKSLSGFGAFFLMGLIGLLIAMVVNMFAPSSGLTMTINVIGVLLFAGLTAYDTQRIKFSWQQQLAYLPMEEVEKRSVFDALTMYLDFLNLFQFLLQFTGTSRSSD